MSNVYVDVNVGTKNHNFNIPLILDKYNIMIIMQKLKYMQEFSFGSMLYHLEYEMYEMETIAEISDLPYLP